MFVLPPLCKIIFCNKAAALAALASGHVWCVHVDGVQGALHHWCDHRILRDYPALVHAQCYHRQQTLPAEVQHQPSCQVKQCNTTTPELVQDIGYYWIYLIFSCWKSAPMQLTMTLQSTSKFIKSYWGLFCRLLHKLPSDIFLEQQLLWITQQLLHISNDGFFCRLWWWRLAIWFEENVKGPVPAQFEFPNPWSFSFNSVSTKSRARDPARDI